MGVFDFFRRNHSKGANALNKSPTPDISESERAIREEWREINDARKELEARENQIKEKLAVIAYAKEQLEEATAAVVVLKSPILNAQEQAFEALKEAAHAGNIDAQYLFGLQQVHGVGVPRNQVLGERWLTKAAQKGAKNAELSLGLLYWEGVLLERGVQQAHYWIEKAARRGDKQALKVTASVLTVAGTDGDLSNKVAEEAASPNQEPHSHAPPKEKQRYEGVDWRQIRRDRDNARRHEEQHSLHPNKAPVAKPVLGDGFVMYSEGGEPPAHGDVKSNSVPQQERETQFEFSTAGTSKRRIEALYERGFKVGAMCNRLAYARAAKYPGRYESRYDGIEGIATEIADERGYLHVGVDKGMSGTIDGADPMFDEYRNVFIEGVVDAIAQGSR